MGERDAGLHTGWSLLARGDKRDRDRGTGGSDLDPAPGELPERDIAALLEPELLEVEIDCPILVADRDADCHHIGDQGVCLLFI